MDHIAATTSFYTDLAGQAESKAEISIRHLARAPVWSYYRLGEVLVTTLYPQTLDSQAPPAMVFATDGETGQFFVSQFDSCWAEAK